MSCHYGYICRTCKEESVCELNHGKDILREFWSVREALTTILNSNTGMFEINYLGTYGYGDTLARFLAKHKDHNIALIDEYGKIEEL